MESKNLSDLDVYINNRFSILHNQGHIKITKNAKAFYIKILITKEKGYFMRTFIRSVEQRPETVGYFLDELNDRHIFALDSTDQEKLSFLEVQASCVGERMQSIQKELTDLMNVFGERLENMNTFKAEIEKKAVDKLA